MCIAVTLQVQGNDKKKTEVQVRVKTRAKRTAYLQD